MVCGMCGTPLGARLYHGICANCAKWQIILFKSFTQRGIKAAAEAAAQASAASAAPKGNTDNTQNAEAVAEATCGVQEQKPPQKEKKVRCQVCKKHIGLTGIQCRCGLKFCGIHRYPNEHACNFDYRAMGAEEIRRNNPQIVAAKMKDRI